MDLGSYGLSEQTQGTSGSVPLPLILGAICVCAEPSTKHVATKMNCSPDPSTAKPMTTEYNQKSLKSFWSLGLASLIGGSRLVNCEYEYNVD